MRSHQRKVEASLDGMGMAEGSLVGTRGKLPGDLRWVESIFPWTLIEVGACQHPSVRCEAPRTMNAEYQSALAALPHGTSFRFVDEIVSLTAGQEAHGIYTVRGDEAFLEGHFPGNPMMPGVILIEAIAQLGGIVVQTDPAHATMANIRLSGVRGAKILGAAVPGDVLKLRAKVEGRMGGLVQIEGDVTGPNGLLASAKVTLSGTLAE